jgi:hypothetical protein
MITEFFPQDAYYCLLDDQPEYLTPQRLIAPRKGEGALMISPHCAFAWQGLPPDLEARIGDTRGLFETTWMVWVDDPATGVLAPYWLGPELARVLADLRPGQRLDGRPREDLLAILWQAGVVVTPDHARGRRGAWRATVEAGAAQAARGWMVLEGLIPAFHVGALRRYVRAQIRFGRLALGDDQSPDRYVAHDEPVAAFFHRQLAQAMSAAAGTSIIPSYCYLTAYQGGADLEPHTDREQCEYTFSLCVDATPEPAAQVPWPLWLQTFNGPVAVWQHLGDGLLFRGRYLTHWRDRLAGDQTVANILFHFVDADPPRSGRQARET